MCFNKLPKDRHHWHVYFLFVPTAKEVRMKHMLFLQHDATLHHCKYILA